LNAARFKQLWDFRNFLAHRGTPPRMHHFASTTGPDIPSAIPSNLVALASGWHYNLELSPQCLVPYKIWLEDSLHQLIKAASAFVSTRL
jgi:hypothetical protein